jgi:hypothetical protein
MMPKCFPYLGATTLAVLVACTTSGNGAPPATSGGDCAYDQAHVLELASGTGSACASCLQNSCGSQVGAYEGSKGCGAYLACVCPGGTASTSTTAIAACDSQLNEASCTSSAQALTACIDTSCRSQCNGTSGGGSGSGGGGSGSSGSSGGDNGTVTLTGDCSTYATCCVNYYGELYASELEAGLQLEAGSYQSVCTSQAESFQSAGESSECTSLIQAYADAGVPGCR